MQYLSARCAVGIDVAGDSRVRGGRGVAMALQGQAISLASCPRAICQGLSLRAAWRVRRRAA
jgi:hypothetical protein